jgi:hypothetical protein
LLAVPLVADALVLLAGRLMEGRADGGDSSEFRAKTTNWGDQRPSADDDLSGAPEP